jgi:hypothetical protein
LLLDESVAQIELLISWLWNFEDTLEVVWVCKS